jgi:uracil-DNA glycosylase family 4
MQKPSECIGCPLYDKGKSFSIPEGKGTNGVVLIGDHLGYEDAIDGLPMRPKSESGAKLEEAFRLLGVDRQQFLLWNTIACQPPYGLKDAPYEQQALEHCRVHFDKVFDNYHTPLNKTVLAMGNIPLVRLTGVTGDSKKKESISHMRGYVFESGYGWVVPTYAPSFVRRGGGHLTPTFLDDIKKAIAVAKGTYNMFKGGKGYKAPDYQTRPSLDDAKAFYYRVKDNPRLILTYDIETPLIGDAEEEDKELIDGPTQIILIQFSLGKGSGIAFPYEGGYIDIAKAIIALPNVKANHNTWLFDNPILKANGFNFGVGKIHDTMWMFKHWHPQLERGLQKVVSFFNFPFAWKHFYGSQLGFYGCADVDAVQYIVADLPKMMKEKGVWEGYRRYVYDLNIVTSKMSARGFPVDNDKRLEVQEGIQVRRDALNDEMQEAFPKELKGVEPKRDKGDYVSYGYLRQPKEITFALAEGRALGKVGKDLALYILDTTGMQVKTFEENGEKIRRWCRINEFKPSSEQVIRYLKWKQEQATTKREQKLYEVPLTLKPNPKTGRKHETTGKDELITIWENTDDPLIAGVIKIRSLNKMLTNDLPNWEPGKDGRVHSEIGFSPPQGQLAARKPNIFNASKHATPEQIMIWGDEEPPTKLFRNIIIAPTGKVLVEFDKKSFHVGMMAIVANDANYYRFSQLDPHSIYTSWIVGDGIEPISFKWSDADILLACDEIKKRFKQVRQQQSKPTVLGNQLGLGPYKLQRQNRKYIKTIKRAEELQERIRQAFPKIEKCKADLIEDAHLNGWNGVINKFGRIQYFFEVYKWKWNKNYNKWEKKHGDDAEKALAFHVQSNSFGMIQDEILEIGETGLDEEFDFCNTIHDSTIFLPEIKQVDKCIEKVVRIMTKPSKVLKPTFMPNGAVINVDVSVGKIGGNLKEMTEIKDIKRYRFAV